MSEHQWQPIETAPRDGSPILIFDPTQAPSSSTESQSGKVVTYDDPRYAIGYWRVWKTSGEWMWGNRNSSYVSPTHWMPLPAPPPEPKP